MNKLKIVEQKVILTNFVKNKANITHTAKDLGIGMRTLQRKLRSYGFPRACTLDEAIAISEEKSINYKFNSNPETGE